MTEDDKPKSAPIPAPDKAPAPGFSAPAAWRIDGIDAHVQSRAAQAAAEANLPLAEWLAKAIDAAATPAARGGWGGRLVAFGAGAALSAGIAFAFFWGSGPAPMREPAVASVPAAPTAPPPAATVATATPQTTPQTTPTAPAASATPPTAAPNADGNRAPVAASPSPASPQPSSPAAQAPAVQPPATASTPAPAPTPAPTPTPSERETPPAPALPQIDPNDPLADLKRAAHGGEAAAQFTLAARYASGDGVDQDWGEAFKWFKLAAEQGMPTAQHNLAVMYERSRGTDQNLEEAVRWYELAAEQGYPPSQFNLAVAYARGWGVEPDIRKAVSWFERAAERIPQANLALAELFETGTGVGRDLARARAYYQLAATAGDQRAAEKLRQLTPEVVQRETIREIQMLLAKLRYNVGTPDGRMGPRTSAAIREFQRSAGLAQDGNATPELLDTLRGVAGGR